MTGRVPISRTAMARKRNSLAAASLSLLLAWATAACSKAHDDVAYSRFTSVPASEWDTLDGREFRMLDNDSVRRTGLYDLVLCVRHDSSYPYRELWLEVEESDMRGVVRTDTVRLTIARSDGSFCGSGRYGLYEVADTVLRSVPQRFGWQFGIRQIMAGLPLKGVNNIGLVLLKK